MRRSTYGFVLGAALLSGAIQAVAQENACTGFNWPLETEVGWMGAADSEALQSGATISEAPARAVSLSLGASKHEKLAILSGVKKQAVGADSFSGWFKIAAIKKPGLYQVSLSRDGWIDVAQGGKLVESTGFTGRRECTLLRKSVRYELSAGEVIIQVVGAPSETIKVTVKAAD